MMRFLMIFCCMAATVMAFPSEAFAWGPGVHTVTCDWVLRNLALLPPLVAEPLARFPLQFLHGCLAPDIFIGKGSVATKGHSHSWDSALRLLERTRTPRARAYAYGYLSHLAADTAAHNIFVPECMAAAPGRGRLTHIYLEAQADRMLAWDYKTAVRVFHAAGSRQTSAMLRDTIPQGSLPFALKKRIFEGSIIFGGSRIWKASMRAADRLLPDARREALLHRLLGLAARSIVSVLAEMRASPVLALDPIGELALARVKQDAKSRPLPTRPSRNTPAGSTCLQELPARTLEVLESLPAVPFPDSPDVP